MDGFFINYRKEMFYLLCAFFLAIYDQLDNDITNYKHHPDFNGHPDGSIQYIANNHNIFTPWPSQNQQKIILINIAASFMPAYTFKQSKL